MGAHALLVGISRFDDPKLAKLNSPQSDVAAFGGVLKDPARGGFDSVEISIDRDLLDIRDQLSRLMDGRSADDMVLLYYSGHGIVAKGGRLYLATGQSSFDRPQARSVATSEIRDLMEQSRAGRLVVILDCCHSGVFAEGAKGAEAPAMTDNTFGDGEGSEGQYVLTATDALQYAYDGAGELREAAPGPTLSRFTRWLVDGIGKGEASPFDEQITLDALYQYLCRRAKTEQAGMTPQRFVKRGSGEMVIAKNPFGKALALPDDLIARL
ncbi:MAG TPA: caspase family protein, partial [Mesorhizobium sp.]